MEKQFPKNVRQIGNVSDEPKIYVEDYVDTYLGQLRGKAIEAPIAVALMGEIVTMEDQNVVYISGALQMKELTATGKDIEIPEETWKQVEADQKEYFAEKDQVGWCLIENGHLMGVTPAITKIHEKIFAKENTIFVRKDATEFEETYYAYKYKDLMQMGGHYIYYEKNPSMQSYMINSRKQIGVTPSEVVEDRAAKDFRNVVKDKLDNKEQQQNSRFIYITSALLVVVVLAIGISTVNNFDKMEAVQTSLESLSQSVNKPESKTETVGEVGETTTEADAVNAKAVGADIVEEGSASEDGDKEGQSTMPDFTAAQEQLSDKDYYVVKKGDTLDTISAKLYGNTSHVEAICKMNGLSDGNLIFIGQKILLP